VRNAVLLMEGLTGWERKEERNVFYYHPSFHLSITSDTNGNNDKEQRTPDRFDGQVAHKARFMYGRV
jgi:hypothetical protein